MAAREPGNETGVFVIRMGADHEDSHGDRQPFDELSERGCAAVLRLQRTQGSRGGQSERDDGVAYVHSPRHWVMNERRHRCARVPPMSNGRAPALSFLPL